MRPAINERDTPAKNFGIIYAGGVQAIRAKLLTLTEEELLNRIKVCFVNGLNAAATRPSPLAQGLEMLARGLNEAEARAKNGDLKDVFESEEQAKDSTGNGPKLFKVHAAELFRTWFPADGASTIRAVIEWLDSNKLFVRSVGKNGGSDSSPSRGHGETFGLMEHSEAA